MRAEPDHTNRSVCQCTRSIAVVGPACCWWAQEKPHRWTCRQITPVKIGMTVVEMANAVQRTRTWDGLGGDRRGKGGGNLGRSSNYNKARENNTEVRVVFWNDIKWVQSLREVHCYSVGGKINI